VEFVQADEVDREALVEMAVVGEVDLHLGVAA
jgi:hypothetical protein